MNVLLKHRYFRRCAMHYTWNTPEKAIYHDYLLYFQIPCIQTIKKAYFLKSCEYGATNIIKYCMAHFHEHHKNELCKTIFPLVLKSCSIPAIEYIYAIFHDYIDSQILYSTDDYSIRKKCIDLIMKSNCPRVFNCFYGGKELDDKTKYDLSYTIHYPVLARYLFDHNILDVHGFYYLPSGIEDMEAHTFMDACVLFGYLDLVQYLYSRGVEIKPIHLGSAMIERSDNVIDFLMDIINVNEKVCEEDACTVLCWASTIEHCKSLIERGAKIITDDGHDVVKCLVGYIDTEDTEDTNTEDGLRHVLQGFIENRKNIKNIKNDS